MGKGKKPLFTTVLCAEASQATVLKSDPNYTESNTERGSKPLPSDQMISPIPQPAVTKPKDKIIVDSKTLFNRLSSAREQAKKLKDLTLVACIVGNPMDLPKIYAKRRIDWRFAKGEFKFSDLKSGWFEILFSNPLDLKKIWENGPYHISGQLLLLKKWYVGFNPRTESTSILDLWIRIHKLPSEYANVDALSAIFEMNQFGSFIRIDPLHAKRRWMTFTRLCVNTDVQLNTGRKIIIPDDNIFEKKYNVWFDDFPMGCGACGDLDHEFDECKDRIPVPPKIQIILPKPPSKTKYMSQSSEASGSMGGWTVAGEKSGGKSLTHSNTQGNKPYLADNSGFSIVYISDESSDDIEEIPEPKELDMNSTKPNKSAEPTIEILIGVQAADTPDYGESEIKRNGVPSQEVPYNQANIQDGHNNQVIIQEEHNNQGSIQDPIDLENNDLEGEKVEVEFLPDEEDSEPFEDPVEDDDEPYVNDPLPTIQKLKVSRCHPFSKNLSHHLLMRNSML